jgi:Na+-driven multidrug efflux pump
MKKIFKWLLIKVVVGALVSGLAIATLISLIVWFLLWPFVYIFRLISVKVDTKGKFISKRDWDDWIA